jgi:hypothetical protein
MIDIRPYRTDDELEVTQLWKKAFPETPLHNDPIRDIQSKLKIQPGLSPQGHWYGTNEESRRFIGSNVLLKDKHTDPGG